jgi:ribosome-binding ATPase
VAPLIGIVGKPSSGKSTILNCLTEANAKIGAYPFTTIDPNIGVAHVKIKCPCVNLEKNCQPNHGYCINGVRFVPVELMDVAGLVPGASDGKGMGNQFLDDLRRSEGFIHVVDISGKSDEQGNSVDYYDPSNDIEWLHYEIIQWIYNITFKDWSRTARKLESDKTKLKSFLAEKLSGLGSTDSIIQKALSSDIQFQTIEPTQWSDEVKFEFANQIFMLLFPIVICANKIDSKNGSENYEKLKVKTNLNVYPSSSLAELTLLQCVNSKLIDYVPGSNIINFLKNDFKEMSTVKAIKEKIIDVYGSTGVYKILESLIFDVLNYIPVFPVEDVTHLTDSKGKILPDVYLVPKFTPIKKFAGKIHSDFEKYFLHAILAENGRRLSGSYELEGNEIVKIVSSAK